MSKPLNNNITNDIIIMLSEKFILMLHFMKIQKEPFEMIKNGKKIYELRLYDQKRRLVKNGDSIEFTCVASAEKITVKVVEILLFPSFIDLYEALSPLDIGYTEQNCKKASPLDMLKYYSKELTKKMKYIKII